MQYYQEFRPINLLNKYVELTTRVKHIGVLYDNKVDMFNLSSTQKAILRDVDRGYSLGEQIYDLYAELGAVLQAMDQ